MVTRGRLPAERRPSVDLERLYELATMVAYAAEDLLDAGSPVARLRLEASVARWREAREVFMAEFEAGE